MVDTFPHSRPSADDNSDAADSSSRRSRIRRDLRAARAALVGAERDHATRQLNDRLVRYLFDNPGLDIASVAGYLAVGGELDIASALATCRRRELVTLLPVLDGDRLVFSTFDTDTPMTPNRFGIDEPVHVPSSVSHAMDIDVVLVPLVGFDSRCARIGMGGGFYDRSFAARRQSGPTPWLIGVAFDCQCVADVLPEWWDVPLDAIITETNVHRRPA